MSPEQSTIAHPFQLQNLEKLEALRDRAALHEDLRGMMQDTFECEGPSAAPPGPEIEDHADLNHAAEIYPCDSGETDGPPKTLCDILLKTAQKPGAANYIFGEPGGSGAYAALKRAFLLGRSRQFIRLVRLKEKMMSQALLENRRTELNAWNQREAELAASRRAANVCAQRTSRQQLGCKRRPS